MSAVEVFTFLYLAEFYKVFKANSQRIVKSHWLSSFPSLAIKNRTI